MRSRQRSLFTRRLSPSTHASRHRLSHIPGLDNVSLCGSVSGCEGGIARPGRRTRNGELNVRISFGNGRCHTHTPRPVRGHSTGIARKAYCWQRRSRSTRGGEIGRLIGFKRRNEEERESNKSGKAPSPTLDTKGWQAASISALYSENPVNLDAI